VELELAVSRVTKNRDHDEVLKSTTVLAGGKHSLYCRVNGNSGKVNPAGEHSHVKQAEGMKKLW